MDWVKLTKWAPLIRTGGNFGVVFFSSFASYDFVYDIPDYNLVVGAVMTAAFTTGLAISYEARKFKVGKK